MKSPVRIQRKRTAGWKMPDNTVYVGRPTIFGNPFDHQTLGHETAVENYRVMLEAHMKGNTYLARAVNELKGKNLACWCSLDMPCHADLLLEMANA